MMEERLSQNLLRKETRTAGVDRGESLLKAPQTGATQEMGDDEREAQAKIPSDRRLVGDDGVGEESLLNILKRKLRRR